MMLICLGILIYKFYRESETIDLSNMREYSQEKSKKTNNQGNSSVLSNKEKEEGIKELKDILNSKTNRRVLSVNQEEISEIEIALIDFQINNEHVNKREVKDAVGEAIRQYVIIQNAHEQNIMLTANEIKNIEESVKGFVIEDNEETNHILETFNMNYEEFVRFYTERSKKLKLITKWKVIVGEAISNGNINIDSEKFKKKYHEYDKSKDSSEKLKILLELLDIYEEYLEKKATIEYFK